MWFFNTRLSALSPPCHYPQLLQSDVLWTNMCGQCVMSRPYVELNAFWTRMWSLDNASSRSREMSDPLIKTYQEKWRAMTKKLLWPKHLVNLAILHIDDNLIRTGVTIIFTIFTHSLVSSQPTIAIIQVLDWQNTVISTITIIKSVFKIRSFIWASSQFQV